MFVVRVCSAMSNYATLWTVTCQASLSMEFSRQKYWSGLPFPTLGESSQPRDQQSLESAAFADGFFTTVASWEALNKMFISL